METISETTIYHITTPGLWSALGTEPFYEAPSLHTEGFIHCSTFRQVERSMNKFFSGEGQLLLLRIDPALLKSPLKYEPADGDQFPHIYGPLNVDAVTNVSYIERGDDGRFHLEGDRDA